MNESTSAVATAPAPTQNIRWRVVDIVVASVIGVASGLVFLLWNIAYRVWNLPVAMLAGVGAALAGGINNLVLWYAGADLGFTVTYLISTVISGALIAGALPWVLTRGLASTGALDRFASGREARVRV